eukprot:SAG22_NODE_5951_length_926_cov_1.899637_2_plen_74_part_01
MHVVRRDRQLVLWPSVGPLAVSGRQLGLWLPANYGGAAGSTCRWRSRPDRLPLRAHLHLHGVNRHVPSDKLASQ